MFWNGKRDGKRKKNGGNNEVIQGRNSGRYQGTFGDIYGKYKKRNARGKKEKEWREARKISLNRKEKKKMKDKKVRNRTRKKRKGKKENIVIRGSENGKGKY